MNTSDLSVVFPAPGVIRLRSRELFENPDNPICRRFDACSGSWRFRTSPSRAGKLRRRSCAPGLCLISLEAIVRKVVAFLTPEPEPQAAAAVPPAEPTVARCECRDGAR